MRKTLLAIMAAAFLLIAPFLAAAEGKEFGIIHVTGNYHMEARDLVGYADGFDVLAGFDFLIWDAADLYIGPRLGWYSETVATADMDYGMHQKPSLGAQVYFLYPAPFLPALAATAGFAFDLLFNFDAPHAEAGEPVYMFTSAFLGIRYTFGRIHLEGRLEAGLFPFFDSPPYFVKFGLQVGYHI